MNAPIQHIRKCFDSELLSFCRVGNFPERDVAFPNLDFKPDNKKAYLRPHLLLNPPDNISLGDTGFSSFTGIYQISIFERADVGLAAAEELASKLINWFKTGRRLDCCGAETVITSSYQGTAVPEGVRLQIPISVVWTCYSQRAERNGRAC